MPLLTPAKEGLVSLRKVSSAVRTGSRALAALASSAAFTAISFVAATGWTSPAAAIGISNACGSGAEARNCPPLCSKLASTVAPSKFFHVPFTKGNWRLDGLPGDVCTYKQLHDPNSTVTDEVDGHETVAGFNDQVKVTKQFNPKATVQAVPALGKYATDIVHCVGTGSSAWCFPNLVVFSKGYIVQAGEALNPVDLATMDKVYLPELVAWVKAVLAKV